MNEIIEIMENENIYGVIIGMPYHLDGSESEMNENVLTFSKNRENHSFLFYYWMRDFLVRAYKSEKKYI